MTIIKTSVTNDGSVLRSIEIEHDTAQKVGKLSNEVREMLLIDAYTIAFQSKVRGMLRAGTSIGSKGSVRKTDAEITLAMAGWVPTPGTRASADPAKKVATIQKGLASMSEADRNALIAQYLVKPTAAGPVLVKAPAKAARKA